jgi:hypothetical protein
MSAEADPILVEKITYYREAEVIVLTPQTGPSLTFRDPPAIAQFRDLEKKLKASEAVAEPILIGDKAIALAPSLTIDAISGPIFWEEIVKLVESNKG